MSLTARYDAVELSAKICSSVALCLFICYYLIGKCSVFKLILFLHKYVATKYQYMCYIFGGVTGGGPRLGPACHHRAAHA